ncbi:uncharacterized mitochondrial protein-like protein, partial [Tanacetum coccineum]
GGSRRGLYSRDRGRGRGQGRGRGNSQNHGQRDSSKNHEDNEQNGKQHKKHDLSHIQYYRCDHYGHFVSKCPERNRNHEVNLNETQEKGVYHEEGTFFMMNHIFMNEEKYTPPKSESNTDEDDVWFGDGSCVSIKGKGSILFQGKNREQKLLKDVYYIPSLRTNVISLGQATIFGYDISIRGDFLTMRDSWGSLLIKVPRNENCLYKAQLKVGKENINEVGRESGTFTVLCNDIQENGTNHVIDKEANPHSNLVTDHETSPESEEDHSRRTSLDCINEFKRRMESQFKMSDLGELTYYLGIEVSQGKDCVEIKQERYARKILKEAGMEYCNATSYPMEKDLKLEVEATQYRKVVGCLRYLLHTRPDLTYSVDVVSRYMQSLRESHARAIKKILRYLKGTTSFGIKYNHSNDMKLVRYSDSSHNVDLDDRRSTTRHVFYLGTSPITWYSQKKTTVALSSCEAEFMAATAAACQAI